MPEFWVSTFSTGEFVGHNMCYNIPDTKKVYSMARVRRIKSISDNSSSDPPSLSNEETLTIWKSLVAGEEAQTTAFDKLITTLSAGALGLSITFIHDIAPTPKETHWLALAWLGFGFALVLNLISYLIGHLGYRRQAKMLEEIANNERKDTDQQNILLAYAMGLNWLCVFYFILGIVGIGMFAWENLKS